jgi:hypothetical protein
MKFEGEKGKHELNWTQNARRGRHNHTSSQNSRESLTESPMKIGRGSIQPPPVRLQRKLYLPNSIATRIVLRLSWPRPPTPATATATRAVHHRPLPPNPEHEPTHTRSLATQPPDPGEICDHPPPLAMETLAPVSFCEGVRRPRPPRHAPPVRSWLCRQNTVLPGVALTRFLGVEISKTTNLKCGAFSILLWFLTWR